MTTRTFRVEKYCRSANVLYLSGRDLMCFATDGGVLTCKWMNGKTTCEMDSGECIGEACESTLRDLQRKFIECDTIEDVDPSRLNMSMEDALLRS